jgi:hypothetical protein
VSDVWVVNASPVIVLAKAGFLRLLEELPTELLLPDAVAAEILVGPVDDPARKAVENGWGARVSPAGRDRSGSASRTYLKSGTDLSFCGFAWWGG